MPAYDVSRPHALKPPGGLPSENVENAPRKIWIKLLKETSLGMSWVLFHHSKMDMTSLFIIFSRTLKDTLTVNWILAVASWTPDARPKSQHNMSYFFLLSLTISSNRFKLWSLFYKRSKKCLFNSKGHCGLSWQKQLFVNSYNESSRLFRYFLICEFYIYLVIYLFIYIYLALLLFYWKPVYLPLSHKPCRRGTFPTAFKRNIVFYAKDGWMFAGHDSLLDLKRPRRWWIESSFTKVQYNSLPVP